MTDETKLQQDINKGNRAQLLLEDPILKEAFEVMEREMVEAWAASPARDVNGRENAFKMVHAIRKTRDLLRSYVSNGKLADAEIRAALRLKAVA